LSLSHLLILGAALVYAAGVLIVKRSADLGVGVWRTAFVANVMCGLLFQPLWLFGGRIPWELWWQPLIVASYFVIGQWLTFMSLEKGDVSVATPVLGLKILLVAILVTFLDGVSLKWHLWVAALLATLAIVLLNRSGRQASHHNIGRTIFTAGMAAVSYALFDVSVQRWSPTWGLGRFLPITMGLSALLSIAFMAKFRAPLSAIPRITWKWLLAGTLTLGLQSVVFVSAVAQWGHAASANVIYSSRGLWTIVLVWIFGQWVRSQEQHLGNRVLTGRLVGALLMMSAIALVLI
jgi:drug/metabolite transporter (DMT)-like permease